MPDIVVRFYSNLDYHQIFVEAPKIKFHENLSSGSHAGTLGQTDGQRRMEIRDDADRYFSLFMRKMPSKLNMLKYIHSYVNASEINSAATYSPSGYIPPTNWQHVQLQAYLRPPSSTFCTIP